MSTYITYYVETNLICLVFVWVCFYIYLRESRGLSESKWFLATLVTVQVHCIVDSFAALFKKGALVPSIHKRSGSTWHGSTNTCTPAAWASISASAKAGCVSVLGRTWSTPSICTTKATAACHPSATAPVSSRRCFTARSLGASGKYPTPSRSSVQPFTSSK